MANKRDYYDVLGLSKGANEQDIKKAYRKLAKQYHPDINKEADAEDKFKEINEANEVLSDPTKRAAYDQYGHAGMEGAQGFGQGFSGGFDDISDIFGSFFGGGFQNNSRRNTRNSNGPRKGQDKFMSMRIDFMDAIFGKTLEISLDIDEQCSECKGSGAKSSSSVVTCSTCGGSGQVQQQQRTPFGVFMTTGTCPTCNGTGKIIKEKCSKCHGKGYEHKRIKLEIKIPAGIQTGQQVRVPNKGERGVNGGSNGDLYIEVLVGTHKTFKRNGNDIHIEVPISCIDAALGCSIDIPTVHGDVELKIPAGTQYGQKFRLKGKGVAPIKGSHGDQIVSVTVEVPSKLSKKEEELFNNLRKETKNNSPFDKFKKAFKL